MSYALLDDQFYDHPKVVEAGNEAIGVWVRCLSYCMKHLTDGIVSEKKIYEFAGGDENGRRIIERLKSCGLPGEPGLLEPVNGREGQWFIHDFHDFQPRAETIKAKRKADAARKRGESAAPPNGIRTESRPDGKAESVASPFPIPQSINISTPRAIPPPVGETTAASWGAGPFSNLWVSVLQKSPGHQHLWDQAADRIAKDASLLPGPLDPPEYARRLLVAFVQYREHCPTIGRLQPGFHVRGFVENLEWVEEWVAGIKPTTAARPANGGARASPAANRGQAAPADWTKRSTGVRD